MCPNNSYAHQANFLSCFSISFAPASPGKHPSKPQEHSYLPACPVTCGDTGISAGLGQFSSEAQVGT